MINKLFEHLFLLILDFRLNFAKLIFIIFDYVKRFNLILFRFNKYYLRRFWATAL